MLPGGPGSATSPASSLDSVYLLVLAIEMACNIRRVECPIGNSSLQQRLLKNRNLGEVDEILNLENVFIQIVLKKDVAIFRRQQQVLVNHRVTVNLTSLPPSLDPLAGNRWSEGK